MGPWGPWGVCLSRHGTSMTGSRVDVVGGSPFGSSLWTAESPLWTPETAGMRLARCFAIFCRGVAISRSRFSSEKGGGAPYSHFIPQQDVNRRRFFRCLSILRAECPALTGSLDSPADISGRWGLAVVSCPHDGRRMERKSTTGSTAMESTEIDIHLSFLGSASPRSWAAKPAMTSRPHARYRRLGWTARDAEAAARSLNLPGSGTSLGPSTSYTVRQALKRHRGIKGQKYPAPRASIATPRPAPRTNGRAWLVDTLRLWSSDGRGVHEGAA